MGTVRSWVPFFTTGMSSRAGRPRSGAERVTTSSPRRFAAAEAMPRRR